MQCWGTGLYGVLGYGNANDIGDNETPASIGTIPSINSGSIEVDGQDRLLRFGSKILTWDANGDLKTIYDSSTQTTQTLTYDLLGNLKQAVLPSKTLNYGVDAHDRRFVKKEGSTVVEHYIWNFENKLKAITDQSGVITKAFVYGTKDHVPDYMITSTGDFQIITDHLGSPVVVVNAATGEVVQEIRYDSFGKVVADTNPGFIPFGYAGCLYDQDTKLCRFGARDYDASIGRWTAKDPILFGGGDTNLYGYVMQDPVNWIDSDGLTADDVRETINFVSSKTGLPKASFSFGAPANTFGYYIPFTNHIILNDSYSKKLSYNQAKSLVRTIHHELTHVRDGGLRTIFGSSSYHELIHMNSQNFADKNYQFAEKISCEK